MPDSFYQIVCIFLFYACVGWAVEVIYATVNTGKFVNRGFLNGPWCPIYGAGMVLAVLCLYPLKENLLILFLGAIFFSTAIELFTGFALEKIFHNKWWDYSNLPYNFKGYICLKFSLYWGMAAVFVIDIIHPIIFKLITIIPEIIEKILLFGVVFAFVSDLTVTVITVLKLNHHIRAIEEIAKKLHEISDDIGENLYEGTVFAQESGREAMAKHHQDVEKFESKYHLEKENFEKKYKELMEHSPFGSKRIMKAFPNMKSVKRDEIFQKYKEMWNK